MLSFLRRCTYKRIRVAAKTASWRRSRVENIPLLARHAQFEANGLTHYFIYVDAINEGGTYGIELTEGPCPEDD